MTKTASKDPRAVRRNELARQIRRGLGTPEIEAEYQRLDDELQAEHLAANPPRRVSSIFDLEVARSMWAEDGREIER